MVAGFLAFIGTGMYLIGGITVCEFLTDEKGKTFSFFYHLKLIEFAVLTAILNPVVGLWKAILIGTLHMISSIISTRYMASDKEEDLLLIFLKSLEFFLIFILMVALFSFLLN